MVNQPKGEELEGFVALFPCGRRLKYKFDDYKRLHFIMTQLTNRSIWQWLKKGKNISDELKSIPDEYYKEIAAYADKLKREHQKLKQEALDVYTRALNFKTRKEQAFFILGESNFKKRDPKFSGIVFKMLDDKDPTELIWNLLYPEAGSTFKGAKNEGNNT